jgi:hypothetical protein
MSWQVMRHWDYRSINALRYLILWKISSILLNSWWKQKNSLYLSIFHPKSQHVLESFMVITFELLLFVWLHLFNFSFIFSTSLLILIWLMWVGNCEKCTRNENSIYFYKLHLNIMLSGYQVKYSKINPYT